MNPVCTPLGRGTAALAAVLLVGTTSAFAADPTSAKTLDALLKAYRMYGLPEPPTHAPLVRADVYGSGRHKSLGFLIEAKKAGDPTRVLVRTGDLVSYGYLPTAVKPGPEALQDVDSDIDLGLAVRCHARGWTDLALLVLERDLAGKDESPETRLARSAWDYWLFAFSEPETDRAKVARLLKVIWEHRRDDFDVQDSNVLDALESSLVPGKGKPGSVEDLIDELIEVTYTNRNSYSVETKDLHPAYMRLARQGFEAVPALIEHLTDERLTRAYPLSFGHYRDHLTVADIVRDLLQSLAGEEVSREWARSKEDRIEKEDIEKWWANARKVGEKSYLTDHVLGDDVGENLWNRVMLDVLAYKYPEELPGVYRRMLKERPRFFGWELGDAVADSELPKQTKRELFLEATRCKGTAIRIDGVRRLLQIDRPKGLDCLLAELSRVPKTPESDYWNCPETALVILVEQINEPAAWAALEKTAKRVDVGLRMELLKSMTWRDATPAVRPARLRFLSTFLDDETVRDATGSSKYNGPVARLHDLPKFEVRNFVAQGLAWQLHVGARSTVQWTDAEWAKLRDDVRKALAREGIR